MTTFGKKIHELRKESKLSQEDIAKKIGTSGTIIGRYERNEMKPSIEVAKNLAKVFHVSIDYLVDENGEISRYKDIQMQKRWAQIEKLSDHDKEIIIHVIDSLIRDALARQTYQK